MDTATVFLVAIGSMILLLLDLLMTRESVSGWNRESIKNKITDQRNSNFVI